MSTTITFNVRLGSSDSGEDIIYDQKKQQLTITKGSICDLLDGAHRVYGAMQAITINPDIDFNFVVSFKNYNLRAAQNYVGQINTTNPIDVSHLKMLKEARLSDFVVKELQRSSELKGKVSQTSKVTTMAGHIVSFNTLTDSIDEIYKIENKRDAMELSEYLTEFFDYLLSSYDEFNNPSKDSLMSHNVMFAGYITLSKLFRDQGIRISKIKNVLDSIDFSRSNPLWKEIDVLDEKETVTGKARTKIKDYFSKIDMKVVA
jgi:hypothetical protein